MMISKGLFVVVGENVKEGFILFHLLRYDIIIIMLVVVVVVLNF